MIKRTVVYGILDENDELLRIVSCPDGTAYLSNSDVFPVYRVETALMARDALQQDRYIEASTSEYPSHNGYINDKCRVAIIANIIQSI